MRSITTAALVTAALAVPAEAAADSLVYEQRGQGIWMSALDGLKKHRVSADTKLTSPSATDDGVVMLVDPLGGLLHRTNAFGEPLNAPINAVKLEDVGDISYFGTPLANISPDGTQMAYTYSFLDTSEPRRGGQLPRGAWSSFWWGAATHQEPGPQPIVRPIAYADPSWVSDSELLVTYSGFARPGIEQAAIVDVDTPEFHPWFSDPQSTTTSELGPWVAQLREGTMTRAHERVAFVATTWIPSNDDYEDQIRIYRMNGEPPEAPTLQCVIPGLELGSPTWSPDGQRLAWAAHDGVHVATIGNRSDCDEIPATLLLPGAKEPFWTNAGIPGPRPEEPETPQEPEMQQDETRPADQQQPPPAGEPPRPTRPAQQTTPPRAAPACTVPRVKGKRLRTAKRLALAGGCRVKITGRAKRNARRAVVSAQRPAAGTTLARNATITLVVRPPRGRS
jgi:hypothetical protein